MMANSIVQSLQIAVRRRLWRAQFVSAARLALWASAGFMLLAVAVHLAVRPVGADTVVLAILALWTAMMAWSALRRPSDSACALWADRHLGGASAFSTLLEMRGGKQAVPNAPAMQWLEHWAAARVPHSLRLLDGRHEPARLSRPFLSVLVCAALATIVLTLPGTAPSALQALAAPSTSAAADRPTPDAERPASGEMVSALASALRAADSRRATDRRDDSRVPGAVPGKSDASTISRMAQPGVAPKGERTTLGDPLPGAVDDAASSVTRQGSGAGSGRNAGESRDDRADAGVSPVPRSTIQVQRRESNERRPSLERQADVDQLAMFDDDLSMHRTATERDDPALAAATPPPATDATPLTPTRAAYVQAWMKASRQRR